jgi:hypothetical protein
VNASAPRLRGIALKAVACGFALVAGVCAMAAAPAGKVTLSAQEQKTMAAGTCADKGLDSVTARSVGASRMAASVRCKPHGKEGEVPVARVAQCEKNGGAWKCAPARDALMLTMYDDSVVALVPEGVRATEAVQTLTTVAGASVPPFQNGAIDVLQDQCTIRQLPEHLFKGATHFKVDCSPGILDVTRDCWNGRCRFFITNAKRRD